MTEEFTVPKGWTKGERLCWDRPARPGPVIAFCSRADLLISPAESSKPVGDEVHSLTFHSHDQIIRFKKWWAS